MVMVNYYFVILWIVVLLLLHILLKEYITLQNYTQILVEQIKQRNIQQEMERTIATPAVPAVPEAATTSSPVAEEVTMEDDLLNYLNKTAAVELPGVPQRTPLDQGNFEEAYESTDYASF
jgi:hypothetical protein